MSIGENLEKTEDAQLFYEVMEIGLGVMGAVGDSPFFKFIDRALDAFDVAEMKIIKRSFEMLSPEEREALIGPESTPSAARAAGESMAAICMHLVKSRRDKADIA